MFWEFSRCDLVAVLLSGFPELSMNPPPIWGVAGTKYYQGSGLSNWAETNSSSISNGVHGQKLFAEHPSGAEFLTHNLTDTRMDDTNSSVQDVINGDRLIAGKGNQTYMGGASLKIVQVCFVYRKSEFGFVVFPICS